MQIKLLNKFREKEYEDFIHTEERSLFNASLKFRDLIEWLTGAEATYLLAVENNKIIGALPSFVKYGKYGPVLNSMPWYGSNPGIMGKAKKELINAFHQLAQDKNVIASTFINRPFEDKQCYDKYMMPIYTDDRIGMVTSLPEYSATIDNDIFNMIHQKTRNLVRKAQKSNIIVNDNLSALHFLANLHKINMEAVGAPPKSIEFFDKLAEILIYDEDYKIYTAEMDGKLIAGLLLKYFNKTVDYMTPAVDVDYRSYQPLNLLIFEAMKDASARGFKYWNWGGTTLPGMEGVYHFKKRWGSDKCIYTYYVNVYKDIVQTKEQLLKEYPYFYVIPFYKLKGGR